jgi:hypothetical protein
MKMKIAVAFAVLFFASLARADSLGLSGPDGTYDMYLPDGSTVTSTQIIPEISNAESYAIVDFTFAEGYGTEVADEQLDGDSGTITFNSPVTDLSFAYSGGSFFEGPCGVSVQAQGSGPAAGNGFCEGPVSFFGWNSGYSLPGGITSMSYTVDTPAVAPEPSSLLLSGIGLALFWLFAKLKQESD